jgi:hypothetical protein
MKYQVISAACVLSIFAVAGFNAPDYVTPADVKSAIQDRIELVQVQLKKQDRLPVDVKPLVSSSEQPANFAERFDAVNDLDRDKYPALAQWLKDKGVIGEGSPAVAKGK